MATAVAKKEMAKKTGVKTQSIANVIQADSGAFATALNTLTSQSSSIATCKSNYQKSMDAMMATWQGASASALAGAIGAIASQMGVVISELEALQGQLTVSAQPTRTYKKFISHEIIVLEKQQSSVVKNYNLSFSSRMENMKRTETSKISEAKQAYRFQERTELIQRQRASGLTVRAWCAEQNIKESNLSQSSASTKRI